MKFNLATILVVLVSLIVSVQAARDATKVAECTALGMILPDDSTACEACPTSQAPSSDYRVCECKVGFMTDSGLCQRCEDGYRVVDSECKECEEGWYCSFDRNPSAADGFFLLESGDVISCSPESACLRGNECEDGYTGDLCGGCMEGFYRLNGECGGCSPVALLWGVVAFGLYVCLAALLVIVARLSTYHAPLAVISFLQIVAVFKLMQGPGWGDLAKITFESLSFLNLDTEPLQLACYLPLGEYPYHFSLWYVRAVGFPVMGLIMFVVLWGVRKLFRRFFPGAYKSVNVFTSKSMARRIAHMDDSEGGERTQAMSAAATAVNSRRGSSTQTPNTSRALSSQKSSSSFSHSTDRRAIKRHSRPATDATLDSLDEGLVGAGDVGEVMLPGEVRMQESPAAPKPTRSRRRARGNRRKPTHSHPSTGSRTPKAHPKSILSTDIPSGRGKELWKKAGSLLAAKKRRSTFLASSLEGLSKVAYLDYCSSSRPRHLLIQGYFLFLSIAYLSMTETAWEHFDCTELPNETWVLDASQDRECFDEKWKFHAPYAGAIAGVLLVLLPGVQWGVLLRHRKILKDASNRPSFAVVNKFGFLFNKYLPRFWYWEGVTIVERVLFLSCAVFLSGSPMGLMAAVAVSVASVVLQGFFKPYSSHHLNFLVLGLRIIQMLLCVVALTKATLSSTGMVATVLDGMCLALVAVGVLLGFIFHKRESSQRTLHRMVNSSSTAGF